MDEIARILKASIAREQNKSMKDEFNTQKALAEKVQQMATHIVKLENERKKDRAFISIMCEYVEDPLQAVERIFETDPTSLDYEALANYSVLSRFMYGYKKRPHIADRVEKRMRELSA